MLFCAAVLIGVALRFLASVRLAFGWAGFVIAVVGAVYFLHPARVTWDGEQWVRQPGSEGLLSQRLLAGAAFLIGVGAIAVAIVNYGTF
jgi:hypothetical protein